ncbi:SO2930 family diheme c-type cytochrome [Ohtaekwangia sp.]|uniref:SO2930 family diheme c-type cytochrome n=1 Tax=Ohtaekwangia sp. TaxID=2066019 RepID=UPI002F95F5B4
MKGWLAGMLGVLALMMILSFRASDTHVVRKEKLSEYNFFTGTLADLKPADGVIPYALNTPLFSNYAEKLRFIRLPEGEKIPYNDSIVFDFPVGTVLIKNFYYPLDFRKPDKGRQLLETRLLVHLENGWEAWPYRWNDEQTEAFYDPAAETRTISYIDKHGKKITTQYAIPNKNQCKGCHIRSQKMMPIGTSARQLNADFSYTSGNENQLGHWQRIGWLTGLPQSAAIPRLAVWDNPSTGSIDQRARAYLDANCAHCHSRHGPANTSGLFLDIYEKDAAHLGIRKTPIAAGRGAGDLQFDILPGEPQRSIMVFRMKTNDPAIAMPEIGREQVHKEGVALIEEWIRAQR